MYEKGKGVKQDDLKALKFYQKACDALKSSCLTPLPFSYESPRLEQRNTPRQDTGLSPVEMMFGRKTRTMLPFFFRIPII
jgi:TPR repeat protein